MTIRAADLLVKCLVAHGIDQVYCVPGESYLSVLDSLRDEESIKVITCRHEGGAGFMALGDARLRAAPAVLLVSRGPGCMNASIAIHSAQQDATPLVVFIGQAERENLRRDAFQGMNYERMFVDVAKWVVELNDPNLLADTICTAFKLAQAGTPGPVIVSLPEDMLEEHSDEMFYPRQNADSTLTATDQDAIVQAIAQARNPLVMAGGLLKNKEGKAALMRFAEHFSLPVATTVRHADLFPNDHPLFAGHLTLGLPSELANILHEVDLIIAVGTRLGDVTTQSFSFPAAPKAAQRLIHIWPEAQMTGRYRHTDISVAAHPTSVLRSLCESPAPDTSFKEWTAQLHEVVSGLRDWDPMPDADDGIVFGNIVALSDQMLPEDAIICLDAGNFGGWVQRLFRFSPTRKLIGPSSGAMGYGIPSAVACSLREPNKKVVCFVGDGGFLMTGSELATARQYGATPIIIISDNNAYGTIRMHQERQFPRRKSATTLHNPDFVAMAAAYGAEAFLVEQSDQFAPALERALQSNELCVIVVRTSLEHISANATIQQLRQGAAGQA
ncbi:thiamine pyrophosphate-binding protein [Paenalcaligenes niemegkensis]|uniref:thiamine pyrophosphate-dependent enzyme n=1 Tax=Paenalcaligenes niemegkensis TaxID=2895469 RepID=UPI001EE808AF|nr:thiamine pyrophosphate-dependent enzyme [Paenalcaligenes niemegkensis]MCQ9618210.1 thiamine pyrophosphate-binding protein [Paenalcaligenes niemegkensis]